MNKNIRMALFIAAAGGLVTYGISNIVEAHQERERRERKHAEYNEKVHAQRMRPYEVPKVK